MERSVHLKDYTTGRDLLLFSFGERPMPGKQIPWSKLKSRVKALIVPELRARLDFHVTSYRRSHDEAEKAWITVDGERIGTFSWYQSQWSMAEQGRVGEFFDRASEAFHDRDSTMARKDILLPQEIGNIFREYPQLGIESALKSPNPLVKALAIVDRRTGRRRLEAITLADDEDELLRTFLSLRREIANPK